VKAIVGEMRGFRASESARLVVGMLVGRGKQLPLGGSVRRDGVPQAGGEPGLPALTTMGL
jgi:hypothetical protein